MLVKEITFLVNKRLNLSLYLECVCVLVSRCYAGGCLTVLDRCSIQSYLEISGFNQHCMMGVGWLKLTLLTGKMSRKILHGMDVV